MAQTFDIQNFLAPPSTELSIFPNYEEEQPLSQLIVCNGVNPSLKIGSLVKDLGYLKIGDTLESGKSITGLHDFRQTAAIQKILATVNNSGGTALVLEYLNSTTWTTINTSTTYTGFEDAKTSFENFIEYCFIVGYDDTDSVFLPVGSLTGTTFSTSTNVTGMPQGKYITRYRDRLYIANCYNSAAQPYRVYHSDVPESGALTWDNTTNFFDVDYGEKLTGMTSNWDRLILFTEFSTYIYNQTSLKQLFDIGCGNNSSIQNIGTYTIFANKDNIYLSDSAKAPIAIGNNVKQLIQNASQDDFRSSVVDNEYNLYVGDTKANGISYTNCLITYNIQTQSARWRMLYDDIKSLAKITLLSDDFLFLGTVSGEIMRKSKTTDATKSYSDNGNPIVAHFMTKATGFGVPNIEKSIRHITAYSSLPNGLKLRARIINGSQEEIMPFTDIGELKHVVEELDGNGLSGNFIQFEGKEYSENQPFQFDGMSIIVDGITTKE